MARDVLICLAFGLIVCALCIGALWGGMYLVSSVIAEQTRKPVTYSAQRRR